MEILNNIWNVLCTENAELVNIITSPFAFLENMFALILFTYILNIKCSFKAKLLYISLSSICNIISNFIIPTPFNVIFNYLIIFAVIYFIFKQGILKSLLALFLPILIFALINLLLLNIYIKFLHITYEQASTIPIYRLFYLLLVYIVFSLIIFILKYKRLNLKILEEFDKKTKKVIIFNIIIGLLTIAFQFIILFYTIDFAELYLTFSNFIILLAYFFINLYSLNKITKLTATTKELETSEAYNKSITALYDNVKGFKHDFDNIVSAIGGYVETNDMEGLKEYYYYFKYI